MKSFIPHGVSSHAQLVDIIKSINHIGAHIINLDAVVDHVADNVEDHSTAISASISSLQDSRSALSQRVSEQAKKKASKDKCKRNAEDTRKNGSDDDGGNQPLSKRVRLAGYKRASTTTSAATISKPNVSISPYEESEKGKNVHKLESIVDQSLRLTMDIVKELDSGVDIDLKGIGYVKTEKASTRYEMTKSLSRKTIREVSPKENIKDS